MSEQTPQLPIPDFIDVDAEAVGAAETLAKSGGAGWSIPKGTDISDPTGPKKQKHARWSEEMTIQVAYRSVTQTGLLDVTVIGQARTGQPNEGRRNFFHFFINNAVLSGTATEEQQKKHGGMTERSLGSIATLLRATGLMPQSGAFKASLLNMLFPSKNQPGTKSPLDGKTVIVNAHATIEKKVKTTTDTATGEVMIEEFEDLRVQADTFLPVA